MTKPTAGIYIAIFLILITLPVLGHFFGWDRGLTLNENRHLAKSPKLSLQDVWTFSSNYVNYFNDNFGFRSQLLELDRLVDIKLFKTAPPQSGVTIGKDGWLFYTADDNYLDTVNGEPLSDSELSQIRDNLEQAKKYFESKGARFYVILVPTAQSIYPEYLPDWVKKANQQSRLDQLTNYLVKNSDIDFINPTDQLIAAKNRYKVYYQHDTHWTQMGAFVAYTTLMSHIQKDFPDIKPLALSDLSIRYRESQTKDMEGMLGVSNYYHENEPILTPKAGFRSTSLTPGCQTTDIKCPEVVRINPNAKLKLLAYRDSYAVDMIPFLSEHFSYADYIWGVNPLSTAMVDKEKPDVVIFEHTAREIWQLPQPIFKIPN